MDLTCVPTDENWLTFGGSWGREWLLRGQRLVDESSFTDESRRALDELTVKLRMIFSDRSAPFYHFQFVGSGFQRKVDRITLGIQNVSGDIAVDVQKAYLEMVKGILAHVDPQNSFFLWKAEKLDVEICLKVVEGEAATWDKAKGMELLLRHLGTDLSHGNCLICGDTASDLPMVEYALNLNPHTYAVFVNPSEEIKVVMRRLLKTDRCCFVSCPEVLHAAMAKALLRPFFIY